MKKKRSAPPELITLMERFCRLGQLLPKREDVETGDYDRAQAEMVMEQMRKITKQMHDEFGIPIVL